MVLLRGVGLEPAAGMTIPRLLFVAYQGTFAITAVASALVAAVTPVGADPHLDLSQA